ncbi:DUF397 domain-containing protein [Streptomyces sp. NBC_00249]|uniref:DUF397 domain-containing protein n=1 Tax=Streptomyces sp. NBC_00249 TaxID=2975690 RepID=UPI002254AAE8|nr:DUF397 domain-containing protein [Streptomyces sp. NBC_00249]MCX5199076.1 DUF397 domain-containing protein [Streptomyces sp. NBC_00249]
MIQNSELEWFKSSYSDSGDINDCVEVAHSWFKSSYSDSSDGNDCVEVANTPATVHVRDSKDTALPHLTFAPHAWTGFLAAQ